MKHARSLLAPAVFALVATATLSAPALAHLYACKDRDGRVWFRNYKQDGEKCRIAMRTDDPEPTDRGGASSRAPATSKREFAPPGAAGAPRPVEEPGSLDKRMALYAAYVEEAAETYKIPVEFIRAVMRVESAFRFQAVSSAGAQGLMQLMPRTARAMGVNDPFDPRQNIMGGARFLRGLANRYGGDMVRVLSAYHAGSGNVAAKGGGIPFETTEGYVRAVLDHYYRYKTL
ncbi:MAG: lytic transglycosylase domain-containing protein [Deltaproteobacteria bacterium]|nr:lytic transglycosylase domain-containing protein [Deltaproteobacteria bacterium]